MEMSIELTKSDILKYLELINKKLIEQNQHGEISICGGAAMALVYDARDATYDIDALYMPKDVISKIIAQIAEEYSLDTHWLNDDFSMFISGITDLTSSTYLSFSNLSVKMVDAKCLLSMKLLSAREESNDLMDAVVLIRHLDIKSVDELHALIDVYDSAAGRR